VPLLSSDAGHGEFSEGRRRFAPAGRTISGIVSPTTIPPKIDLERLSARYAVVCASRPIGGPVIVVARKSLRR